jgi:putative Ca2+/H+ antiporter (TMEM165/GDT1 family)
VLTRRSHGACALGLNRSHLLILVCFQLHHLALMPAGVVLGAVAGHGVATVIAVLGGSFLKDYLSERLVRYVGGSLFLIFAAATIFDIATGAH